MIVFQRVITGLALTLMVGGTMVATPASSENMEVNIFKRKLKFHLPSGLKLQNEKTTKQTS